MTMRPKRSETSEGEVDLDFEDPLKNYAPPEYADELERSLAEDVVAVMQNRPVKTVPPTLTIEAAMKLMLELDIACLLVTEGDKLVGIFSERDMLAKVALDWEAMRGRPVQAVMTPNPVAVYETDTPGKALNVMVTGGFRHVPVLDVDNRVIGILGPRRVTAYLQRHLPRD